MPSAITYSWFMTLVIAGLLVCIAVLSRVNRTFAKRGAFALLGWLAITGGLGASGALSWESMPPRPVIVFNIGILITFAIAFSRVGKSIAEGSSFIALTGYQVLRIPIEGFLAHGATVDLVPRQMTWEGRNFDIVTGVLALFVVIALLRRRKDEPLGKKTRAALLLFNIVGVVLLVVVISIALMSTPPLFEQSAANFPWLVDLNTWISRAPWIWLPTFLVPGALFFHLISFRKLRSGAPGRDPAERAISGP